MTTADSGMPKHRGDDERVSSTVSGAYRASTCFEFMM